VNPRIVVSPRAVALAARLWGTYLGALTAAPHHTIDNLSDAHLADSLRLAEDTIYRAFVELHKLGALDVGAQSRTTGLRSVTLHTEHWLFVSLQQQSVVRRKLVA
jgi:hypothetical protein